MCGMICGKECVVEFKKIGGATRSEIMEGGGEMENDGGSVGEGGMGGEIGGAMRGQLEFGMDDRWLNKQLECQEGAEEVVVGGAGHGGDDKQSVDRVGGIAINSMNMIVLVARREATGHAP